MCIDSLLDLFPDVKFYSARVDNVLFLHYQSHIRYLKFRFVGFNDTEFYFIVLLLESFSLSDSLHFLLLVFGEEHGHDDGFLLDLREEVELGDGVSDEGEVEGLSSGGDVEVGEVVEEEGLDLLFGLQVSRREREVRRVFDEVVVPPLFIRD